MSQESIRTLSLLSPPQAWAHCPVHRAPTSLLRGSSTEEGDEGKSQSFRRLVEIHRMKRRKWHLVREYLNVDLMVNLKLHPLPTPSKSQWNVEACWGHLPVCLVSHVCDPSPATQRTVSSQLPHPCLQCAVTVVLSIVIFFFVTYIPCVCHLYFLFIFSVKWEWGLRKKFRQTYSKPPSFWGLIMFPVLCIDLPHIIT